MNNRNTANNRTTKDGVVGLCLGVALSISMAFCVEPPAVEWMQFYGDSLRTSGYSIQQLDDGGFVAAGWIRPGRHRRLRGLLVRTDSGGDVRWEKTFAPSNGTAQLYSVHATEDGGFIMGGLASDTLARVGPLPYLVKADSAGDSEWERVFWEDTEAIGYGVAQAADGGYALCGVVSGARPTSGFCLYKTDESGALQWRQIFREDVGKDASLPGYVPLLRTSDGGYLVGGRKDSSGVWLIKTDSLGTAEWQRTYVGQLVADVRSTQQTDDGGYIVTGAGASSWLSPDRSDVYLMKLNAIGGVSWKKTFGGRRDDCGVWVRETPDSGYIVAGLTNSFGTDNLDAYILRTDAVGTLKWTKTLGDYGHEARAIEPTRDGGYIIIGWTYNSGANDVQMELVKLAADGEE